MSVPERYAGTTKQAMNFLNAHAMNTAAVAYIPARSPRGRQHRAEHKPKAGNKFPEMN
jgi:hypothetical protein